MTASGDASWTARFVTPTALTAASAISAQVIDPGGSDDSCHETTSRLRVLQSTSSRLTWTCRASMTSRRMCGSHSSKLGRTWSAVAVGVGVVGADTRTATTARMAKDSTRRISSTARREMPETRWRVYVTLSATMATCTPTTTAAAADAVARVRWVGYVLSTSSAAYAAATRSLTGATTCVYSTRTPMNWDRYLVSEPPDSKPATVPLTTRIAASGTAAGGSLGLAPASEKLGLYRSCTKPACAPA
mmetsp:Transcript_4240/g.15648  ORF Transcript_4240/g.15648 Transcript_4240/m.15648 type:complete len:246 (+) Transcript_4240:1237-1974(+)